MYNPRSSGCLLIMPPPYHGQRGMQRILHTSIFLCIFFKLFHIHIIAGSLVCARLQDSFLLIHILYKSCFRRFARLIFFPQIYKKLTILQCAKSTFYRTTLSTLFVFRAYAIVWRHITNGAHLAKIMYKCK